MSTNVFPAILVVLAVAVFGAACGGPSSSGPTAVASVDGATATTNRSGTDGSTSDAASVAWVDQVCGQVVRLTESFAGGPAEAQDTDLSLALTSFQQWIDRQATAVGQALTALQASGPSPIVGGDQVQSTIILALQRSQASYQRATEQVAAIDLDDFEHLQNALDEVSATVIRGAEEITAATLAMQVNTTIADIVGRSTTCRPLTSVTTATTP